MKPESVDLSPLPSFALLQGLWYSPLMATTYTILFDLSIANVGFELWLITGDDIGLAVMFFRGGKVFRQIEARIRRYK